MMQDRPLVCSIHRNEVYEDDVCPCYHNAIAEDIRTTWSKIDLIPATKDRVCECTNTKCFHCGYAQDDAVLVLDSTSDRVTIEHEFVNRDGGDECWKCNKRRIMH